MGSDETDQLQDEIYGRGLQIELLKNALKLQDDHIRGAIAQLKLGNISGAMVCLVSARHPDDR